MREKKHRLPTSCYQRRVIVSFTLCLKNRIPVFTEKKIVDIFTQVLLDALEKFDCESLVYLFMPDHCHFLKQGKSDHANVIDVINDFKKKTGFWLYKNAPNVRWQKDYYDHIVRSEDEIQRHIWYILGNPVRKNIIQDWKEYPFKGSTVYDLHKW